MGYYDLYSVSRAIASVNNNIYQANAQRDKINRIIQHIQREQANLRAIRRNLKTSFSVGEQEIYSEILTAADSNLASALSSMSPILNQISMNVNNYYNKLNELRWIKRQLELKEQEG